MTAKDSKQRKIGISDVLREGMFDFGLWKNEDQSIPHVSDGLKPVHRRLVFGAWESGYRSGGKFVKSARIVWDVMGKYHPHGDSAIYGAMVRLAQKEIFSHPLFDKQWNFGSVYDLSGYAHYRYTEAKLSEFAEDVYLADLKAGGAEMVPNYDGTRKEPFVLPARLPMALVNPNFGIGWGISSSLPPHNLSEVVEAVVAYVKNPEKFEASKWLKGPDFPCRNVSFECSENASAESYAWESGSFPIIAKVSKKGRSVVIEGLPYDVQFQSTVEKLTELAYPEERGAKQLFSGITNKSSKGDVLIEMHLRPEADADDAVKEILKKTDIRTTVQWNPICLDSKKRVRRFSVKEIIAEFVAFRRDVNSRIFRHALSELERESEILRAKTVLVANWREIWAIVEKSSSDDEAAESIRKKFSLSPAGCEAVLSTQMRHVKKLDAKKMADRLAEIVPEKERLEWLLSDSGKMGEHIVADLRALKRKYGTERKTPFAVSKPE